MRGTGRIRLGGLGFTLVQQPISVADSSTTSVPQQPPIVPLTDLMVVQPNVRDYETALRAAGAFSAFSTSGPPQQDVIDTDGEVISEQTSPGVITDPGLTAAESGVISDISPTLVPRREAWKTWLPIGIAVVGIAGAVWILRKK